MQATLERLRARREERGDEGGFTLIELLIVIVILGILAAIVVFAVQNLTSSSAQSSCRADYKNVETAVEAYKAQMLNYPSGSAATAGPTPNTDNNSGTAAGLTANTAPTTPNAAVISGTSPNFVGGELLWGGSGATTAPTSAPTGDTLNPNTAGTSTVGPWLKDAPVNSGHYTIFVSNDGTGTVAVLDANGKYISAGIGACGSVN